MHCLFGAQPSTSSPVEPMGSDIHPHIHTQSFTYQPPPLPPLGLSLNRPAFLTTFTQWSECTKPSGEIQSVCETERHKCRFGCASCKQNKERSFTFSGLFEMPGVIWMSLFPIFMANLTLWTFAPLCCGGIPKRIITIFLLHSNEIILRATGDFLLRKRGQ